MIKRDIVLIVDDIEMNRAILAGIFGKEYRSLEAENGMQALELMQQYQNSIAVVLLDIMMPVMDGYQVMLEMNRLGLICKIPVIIITADSSTHSELKAFDAGAADVITKPFEAHLVRRRVQNVVELNLRKLHQDELIEEQATKLMESNAAIISTLASVVEARSLETGLHIKRIGMYTKVLLEHVVRNHPEYILDDRQINIIVNAASLHDIGKIAIPDAVLNKPGRLTPDEYAVMKTHSVKGCEMLANLSGIADREYLQYAYNICRYHHERWDGSGYPDRLKGDAIPIYAQIVGVADCYDALTTDRVYKKAIPLQQAISMILNGECGVFSPKLLESLKAVQSVWMQLSAQYADSQKEAIDAGNLLHMPLLEMHKDFHDTQHSDSLKYFALLKYLKSTVMEVDLTSGIYHVVYQYSNDFDLLKSGSSFAESILRFSREAVHPDDQERVLQILGPYTAHFFSEGLLEMQRSYRIYNRASAQYLHWQATMLRVNPDAPRQQKVILIWNKLENAVAPAKIQSVAEEIILQNMIVDVQPYRNDRWLTMPHANHGLLDLLGYSQEEVQKKFQNRYLLLIHPDDREAVLRESMQQQRKSAFQEFEYRVVARDGSVYWLLSKSQLMTDSTGAESFYCVLIDITQSKKVQEELHALIERYQIVMDQTNDIIFEWHADSDELHFSPRWNERFGRSMVQKDALQYLTYASDVHPSDCADFSKMIDQLFAGRRYGEAEVRLYDSMRHFHWCRFRITAIRDHYGQVVRMIGVIADIDSEKRASQELRDMAERDSLTQLYNKRAATQKIGTYIERMGPEDSAVMFVIDVDDFKKINDHCGHMRGDALLQEIAMELKRIFRNEDIVARIGGDEFLVFMTSVREPRIIEERASRINSLLHSIVVQHKAGGAISCSIGVVSCPQCGRNFNELFEHGDVALYDAKRKGKNQHSFYKTEMEDTIFKAPGTQLVTSTQIDSDLALENPLA